MSWAFAKNCAIETESTLLYKLGDHVLTLNKGELFAMGDDMLGQCGQPDTDINTYSPFAKKKNKISD